MASKPSLSLSSLHEGDTMFVPFPKCGLEHALTNRTPETKILIRIGALVPVHPRRDPRGETTPLSCFPFLYFTAATGSLRAQASGD